MEMPGFKFECQFCHQRIEVPSDMVGQIIDCPLCGKAIAVPAPAGMADLSAGQKTERRAIAAAADLPTTQPCPHCSQVISIAAKRCPYCGEYLGGVEAAVAPTVSADLEKQIVMLGGFVCLLIGIALHGHGEGVTAYIPLYLLSFVLGVVSIFKKQIVGGAIVLLATALVPLSLRPIGGEADGFRAPPKRTPPHQARIEPIRRPPVVTPTPRPEPVAVSKPPAPALGPSDLAQTTVTPTVTPVPVPPAPTTNAVAAPPATPAPPEKPAKPATPPEPGTLLTELAKDPASKEILGKLKAEIKSMPDGDQKIKFMTAYGLGCLYTGKADEGTTIATFLAKQYPDNTTAKNLSADRLTGPCDTCMGTGSVMRPCSECDGLGKCAKCGGTGTRSLAGLDGSSKTVKCLSCDSGKCKKCKGTGQIKQTCSACGGAKTRISENKIKENYFAVLGVAVSSPPPTTPQKPQPQPPAEGEDAPAE
jgi:ribosomal protein L32